MKKIVCLILAAAIALGLCACGARKDTPAPISLWYAEDDPLAAELSALAEEYDNGRGRDAAPVSLRAFEDEAQLSAALRTAQPELLLCSHALAFSLYARGALAAVDGVSAPWPDWLSERSESVGVNVFPLGAEVQLLCAAPGTPANAAAPAAPYTVDSFAALICQRMLDRGSEFLADGERDLFNADYRAVYNELAQDIYDGRLILTEQPGAELVAGGALPCAIVGSASLAARRDLAVSPLPEKTPVAEGYCLAVLRASGQRGHSAAAFLTWLLKGERAGSLALQCGLVPLCPAAGDGSPLSEALLKTAGEPLCLPDGESAYYKNRADFEAAFRAATEFLK